VKPEAVALARHRFARAHAALREADLLAAEGAWAGAVNRYYYADFVETQPEEAQRLRGEVHSFVEACVAVLDRELPHAEHEGSPPDGR